MLWILGNTSGLIRLPQMDMTNKTHRCTGCKKICVEPEGVWAWKPPTNRKVFFCSSLCAEEYGYGHAAVEALPPQSSSDLH
jgi:hypothetical protein